jgi:acylphosphatase
VRRVCVTVSGRVQGVFYRATCARLAREKGLAGSVRNRPDGGVEAVFEGPPDAIEDMVAWCRQGPELARVDQVDLRDEEPRGEAGFRVMG